MKEAEARAKAQRLMEAAAWRLHLTETGAETTPAFQEWLADEANVAVWREIDAPWSFLENQKAEPASVKVRLAALQNARRAGARYTMWKSRWRLGAAAAACLMLVAAGWGAYLWLDRPDDYATALHERRIISLPDGSRVSLDSNSEVTVRYTRAARELHLLHGQARFDVAHDVLRPFSVLAGDQKVIATGTAFNVDIAGSRVLVTLIEGHVVVLDQSTSAVSRPTGAVVKIRPVSVELKAGQQLAAIPAAPPEVEPANIQRVTAWTNGQLMFDDEQLADVVARVNRYTNTPVEVDDPKAAKMRISGVFNAGDVNSFVDIVTQFLPLKAVPTDSGKIVLKEKN